MALYLCVKRFEQTACWIVKLKPCASTHVFTDAGSPLGCTRLITCSPQLVQESSVCTTLATAPHPLLPVTACLYREASMLYPFKTIVDCKSLQHANIPRHMLPSVAVTQCSEPSCLLESLPGTADMEDRHSSSCQPSHTSHKQHEYS